MKLEEYIIKAERTMNDKGFFINMLHTAWGIFTEVAELVDQAKKHIFYGKELDLVNLKEELGDVMWYLTIIARASNLNADGNNILANCIYDWLDSENSGQVNLSQENLIDNLDDLQLNLEYLRKECMALYRNESTGYLEDYLNDFIRAFFDLSTSLGLKFEDILDANIRKLEKRFPEKFTEDKALNRDLKVERQELELQTKTEQEDYPLGLFLTDGVNKYPVEVDNICKFKEQTPQELRDRMEKGIEQMVQKWIFIDENARNKVTNTLKKGLLKDIDNSGIDNRVPKVGE